MVITKSGLYLIAHVLRDAMPRLENDKSNTVEWFYASKNWVLIVLAFADILEKNNPRFKRAKFLKECGYIEHHEVFTNEYSKP